VPANHVPEASVIRGAQALPGITGRKEKRRRLFKSYVKSSCSTGKLHTILEGLREIEEIRIPGGAVKCVDIRRNTKGEGKSLGLT
jgi:hypothetical protein